MKEAWFAHGKQLCYGTVFQCAVIGEFVFADDAIKAALGRNAFDVMIRRGWAAARDIHQTWFVQDIHCNAVHKSDGRVVRWPDPFTALVEAERQYAQGEERPQ